MNRRSFLGMAAATLALGPTLGARPALANLPANRTLSLFEIHRRERLDIQYVVDGWYHPDALAQLDLLLRDRRTDEVLQMDTGLLDILWALGRATGSSEPIHIVSAYRSPTTNAARASVSGGVARNSYHMYGQAADIRLPGYRLSGLRNAAVSLNGGGVGFYPRSDFIHVDTGPIRTW